MSEGITGGGGGLTEDAGAGAPPADAPKPAGDERDRKGRFARGNTQGSRTWFEGGNLASFRHGLRGRTEALPPELERVAAEIDAFVAGCLVDEGDADDVPTRRRALIAYRGRLHRKILLLDSALELRGLIDRRGKLRVQWLGALANLITVAKSLDALLGLERRQKRVQTLEEYLREHYGAPRDAAPTDEPQAEDASDRPTTGRPAPQGGPADGGRDA